jgi:hypothetical protein
MDGGFHRLHSVHLFTAIPPPYTALADPEHKLLITRFGENHTNMVYTCTAFLAGRSPNIRSYTVCILTILASPTHEQ